MNYNIIPVEVVKSITGATTDAVANAQGAAVVGMVQAYLGLVLVEQDFSDEKVPIAYEFQKIIHPKYAPINSVTDVKILTSDGTYKSDVSRLSVGEFVVELLPTFWWGFPKAVLPAAVSGVEMSYNAGLYSTWTEIPGVIQEALQELLKYKFAAGYAAGFHSEHLGDYSYTKGTLVRGLPVEIAGMLDGLNL